MQRRMVVLIRFVRVDVMRSDLLTRVSVQQITGLRSPTYFGRPNFDQIYQELCRNHPNQGLCCGL